jgi:Ion channel
MLSKLLVAWCLMTVCVVMHAVGLTLALRALRRRPPVERAGASIWLCTTLAGSIVLLHTIEITVWAVFYAWRQALPDLQSSLYFSAVTYTTTGYGDIVLPTGWQLFGAVEALTGILMNGLSTGFFFAVVSRMLTAGDRGVDATP